MTQKRESINFFLNFYPKEGRETVGVAEMVDRAPA
jgi:hypothetical protein